MGEQRNLTEDNVEVLTKYLKEMKETKADLEYQFFKQFEKPSSEQIIKAAEDLCVKFIEKVETGRARSIETYSVCKTLLGMIKKAQKED